MNDVLRSIMKFQVHMELGVAPIEQVSHDVNKILASLPPEEARKLKRRFRKLWRAAARDGKAGAQKRRLGFGEKNPTKSQKTNRKAFLMGHVFRETEARIKSLN